MGVASHYHKLHYYHDVKWQIEKKSTLSLEFKSFGAYSLEYSLMHMQGNILYYDVVYRSEVMTISSSLKYESTLILYMNSTISICVRILETGYNG